MAPLDRTTDFHAAPLQPPAVPGPSERLAGNMEVPEIEELEPWIRGWRVRFTRVAPGPCPARMQERCLPSLRLVRLVPGAPVAVSSQPLGEVDPFQVGIVSPEPGRLIWDGSLVHAERLLVKDGSDGSNFVLPGGCELIVARLDRRRLAGLSRAFARSAGERPRRLDQYRMSAPELGELRAQLRTLFDLDPAAQPHLIEVAEQDVHARVALALGGRADPFRLSPGDRQRVLRDAEAWIRDHPRERSSLLDLCLASGCSERTLRYAFGEYYGISPASFVKRVRLQGLRGDLLRAAPGSAKVIDLALHWGFWHLGHLSRDYKRLFGETPIESLARTAVGSGTARRRG